MPAAQTRVQQLTAYLIHLASAVSPQDRDLVGELIAERAISSPLTHCQFAVAMRLAQPSCVREIQQGFPAALPRSTSPLGACAPGEHIGSQGHGHQLAMGIVAAPHCQPTAVVTHDRLVVTPDMHCQEGWLPMRKWGVVPFFHVHRLHGHLGTHSRLCVGHRPCNLRGQSDGDLGNL